MMMTVGVSTKAETTLRDGTMMRTAGISSKAETTLRDGTMMRTAGISSKAEMTVENFNVTVPESGVTTAAGKEAAIIQNPEESKTVKEYRLDKSDLPIISDEKFEEQKTRFKENTK